MQVQELTVTNRLGLHARACSKIVEAASRFRSNVSLTVRGHRASARSIVALMLLSASVGNVVRLEVDGPDEGRAMREIAGLFVDRFGEQ
jgi:phosphocarrier protein